MSGIETAVKYAYNLGWNDGCQDAVTIIYQVLGRDKLHPDFAMDRVIRATLTAVAASIKEAVDEKRKEDAIPSETSVE